jgi:hypothetical protein
MILSVMQPTYLPWLGYFDFIDSADRFVFLDNVQLDRTAWQIRNRIKSAQGELMLSVSISTPNRFDETYINQTQFTPGHHWRKKHLKSIATNYRKSAYFDLVYSVIEELYSEEETYLSRFNIKVIEAFCQLMGIDTPRLVASELQGIEGVKDVRLTSLCKTLGCGQYLSPLGAMGYMEKASPGGDLVKNGIELYYHQFVHPEYPQLYGGFVSHLSIIDALFNLGPEKTLSLMRSSRKDPLHYKMLYVKGMD